MAYAKKEGKEEGKDYNKKLVGKLNQYAQKAALLEKEDPFNAAQIYAKLGTYDSRYTEKARGIAKSFEKKEEISAAGMIYAIINSYTPNKKDEQKARGAANYLSKKGDENATTQVLSAVSKEDAEKYAGGLEKLGKYDQAGISYMHAGNYKKAKEMIGKAVGANQTTGALKALKVLDELERKSAGIAEAYEKKQQTEESEE